MIAPDSYAKPPENTDDSQDQESDESSADTVLVDKSVFGDELPEPGDTVTFTFVRSYEDEVELKLADDSETGDDGTPESADRALGEMAA